MAQDLSQAAASAGLIKPGAGAAPTESGITTIPDAFYGAALKKKYVPEKPAAAKDPATPPKAPPPAGPPGAPKKKNMLPFIIGGAILLLLVIGGALFWLTRPKAGTDIVANANTNTPVVVTPTAPICGDAKCDAPGETYGNCSADCPKPPPFCGDSSCDTGETHDSCSADCPKPEPVCGDSKCEAPTEDFKNCSSDCQPPEPVAAMDTDSDGLTDDEETGIYGTDKFSPDTDGDSFVDLNEVINMFDPAKPRPSEMKDNPGIAVYENAGQKYELLRPAAWSVKELGEAGSETFFTAPTGEFVQVIVQPNADKLALVDWYLKQAPDVRSSEIQIMKTRGGFEEVLSPDRMTAYLAVGDSIVIISYNMADQISIRYKATFQMTVNSFAEKLAAPLVVE